MKSRTNHMASSSSFLKREFLKNWMKGLSICTNNYFKSKKDMSVFERQKAIKLSADVAIASTRINSTTRWRRALLKQISGNLIYSEKNNNNNYKKPLITRTKKILRRSKLSRRVRLLRGRSSIVKASSIAKRLVKDKTHVLRSLVPGGEQIEDDVSLIKETLDYIAVLRVQVDEMRRIANAAERLDHCGVYKSCCSN